MKRFCFFLFFRGGASAIAGDFRLKIAAVKLERYVPLAQVTVGDSCCI